MTSKTKDKLQDIIFAIIAGFIIALMLLFINGCSLHEWNKDYWGYV